MTATRAEIEEWFDLGVNMGMQHMIIVCDTFDFTNFAIYVVHGADARAIADEKTASPMLQVDEVYDLRLDKKMQLAEDRAFHY